ncbi:MAG: hemin uptake protein HemP [Burkholderiales bacterium]|nr:hemin uptake protein HemP [Burkholderiales bacterium]
MNLLDTRPLPAATGADDDTPCRSEDIGAPPRGPRVRLIASAQLFAGFPEVQITHGDAIYRLRQTSLGKLILTK